MPTTTTTSTTTSTTTTTTTPEPNGLIITVPAAVQNLSNNKFIFKEWSGDASGTDNPLTNFNLPSNKTIIANYDPFDWSDTYVWVEGFGNLAYAATSWFTFDSEWHPWGDERKEEDKYVYSGVSTCTFSGGPENGRTIDIPWWGGYRWSHYLLGYSLSVTSLTLTWSEELWSYSITPRLHQAYWGRNNLFGYVVNTDQGKIVPGMTDFEIIMNTYFGGNKSAEYFWSGDHNRKGFAILMRNIIITTTTTTTTQEP